MKYRLLCVALLFSLLLCGCSRQRTDKEPETNQPDHSQAASADRSTEDASTGSEADGPSGGDESEPAGNQIAAPTREEVYAAKELALEGMTEEQVQALTDFIRRADLWLEHEFMYDRFYEHLSDREDPAWNYFHQTGEIQIGWGYDGDLDMEEICAEEDLSETEFYEKYATPVSVTNPYDADGFVAEHSSLQAGVQNEDLRDVLQDISEECLLAKDTHDAVHVSNAYHALHDLDCFLLHYALEDVGPYVTDTSTLSKYYGTLPFYPTSAQP